MDGGIDFGEGIEDFVAIRAFGDDSSHKEAAADLFPLGHSEFGEEGCEWNSGVGFAGLGMSVVDSDSYVGQCSNLGGGEGERRTFICDGKAGRADSRSMVVHFLRGSEKYRAGREQQNERDGNKGPSKPHAVILAEENR